MPESLVDRQRIEAARLASGNTLGQRSTPDVLGFREAEIREIVAVGKGNVIMVPHRAWAADRRVPRSWDPDARFDDKGRELP